VDVVAVAVVDPRELLALGWVAFQAGFGTLD
jgi:hypothetical protein